MEKAKTPIIKIKTTSHSTMLVADKMPSNPPIINFTTDQVNAVDNSTHDKGYEDVGFSFVRPKAPEDIDVDDTFERNRQKTIDNIVTINETYETESCKDQIDTPISISKRVSIRRRPNNIGTRLTYSHKKIRDSAIDLGKSIHRSTADHQISLKLFDSTDMPSLSEIDSPIANQSKAVHVKISDLNRTGSSKLFESSNPTDLCSNDTSHLDSIERTQSSTSPSQGSHLITSVQNDSDIIKATNVINKLEAFDSRNNKSFPELEESCSDERTTASSHPDFSKIQTANKSLSEGESTNESLSDMESINGSLNSVNSSLIDSQLPNQSTFNSTSVKNNSSVAETIAVVTVSSTISGDHSSTPPTTTTAKIQSPKISLRLRVGFDDLNSVHELSNNLQLPKASNDSPKIVIKGGKWRRTIYDIRKSKLTNCK